VISWRLLLCLTGCGVVAVGREENLRLHFRGTLSGGYLEPEADAACLAIVISGSGASNRNGSAGEDGPLKALALRLAAEKVATLRLDKRGMGESTGSLLENSLEVRALDVSAWINFSRERRLKGAERILLVGYSEGGTVALKLAATRKDIAGAVLICSPMLPGADFILQQNLDTALARGATQDELAAVESFTRRLTRLILEVDDRRKVRQSLEELTFPLPPAEEARLRPILIQNFSSPAYMSLVRCRPIEWLRAARCPLLLIFAGQDRFVNAKTNSALAAPAVRPPSEIAVLPGLAHELGRSATIPASARDGISDELLLTITQWLDSHASRQ
jgi:pimeloyl-ACP methyl ester carboxylesterase